MKIDDNNIKELFLNPATRREAFAQVVKDYSESLYWQIRRMVMLHEDANDILQNTFVKAWSNLEYFRGEAKLSTWLYRIALNECLSFISKKKTNELVSIEDENSNLENMLENDPYFDGDRTQILLQKAIHTLPEKQRIIFNLRYYQDMKYEEISEIMGTTVGALKASYHHAVKKIEDFFNEND